jgi:hypothetical protein
MKASTLELEGARSRFCQQCSRVEPLTNFDGLRRSCRDGLARIGERRREKVSAQQQVRSGVISARRCTSFHKRLPCVRIYSVIAVLTRFVAATSYWTAPPSFLTAVLCHVSVG